MAVRVEQAPLIVETGSVTTAHARVGQAVLITEVGGPGVPVVGKVRVEQAALIFETLLSASMVTLIGGHFQDGLGRRLANGYLTMTLSQEGAAPGSRQIVSGPTDYIRLDNSGDIADGGVAVWPNDGLAPSGSFYWVQVYDANGTQAFRNRRKMVVPTFPLTNSIANVISLTP